jgi:ABC-type lipoprotein export system ATPase subunit
VSTFIDVRGLSKSYAVGTRQLSVLRDLDLQMEAGEMLAVVGASGVGKSTLLHVLGGLD